MSEFFNTHLEHIERQLRALAGEFTRVQTVRFSATPCWSPAINVYRCGDRFIVCLDLSGVEQQCLLGAGRAAPFARQWTTIPARTGLDPPQPMMCWRWKLICPFDANCASEPLTPNAPRRATRRLVWIQLPLRSGMKTRTRFPLAAFARPTAGSAESSSSPE